MDNNVDYKEMYLIMARAARDAAEILIKAQQKCEELYIAAAEKEESKAPCPIDR